MVIDSVLREGWSFWSTSEPGGWKFFNIKAWFQMQWQLNCKRHFTSIYIMFDVFKHHSKMLKGGKFHLNIIF